MKTSSRPLYALAAGFALMFAASAPTLAKDRDNNPPGPAGGPGTNWENPPGPKGGPGASKNRKVRVRDREYDFRVYRGGYYFNQEVGYWHPRYGFWNSSQKCWFDNDNNPPGRAGGPGTNWENPPGLKGGPGASPNKYGKCR